MIALLAQFTWSQSLEGELPSSDCSPIDPICADEDWELSPEGRLQARPRSSTRPTPQTSRFGVAAPDLIRRIQGTPQPAGPVHYDFEDEEVAGRRRSGESRITAHPVPRARIQCLDEHLRPVIRRGPRGEGPEAERRFLEEQRVAYRLMLRCIDSCYTAEDIEFLVHCSRIGERGPSTCGSTAWRNAFRYDRLEHRHQLSADQPQCVPDAVTQFASHRIKLDLVVLIDNSSSMEEDVRELASQLAPRLAQAVRALPLDTRLILMTQWPRAESAPSQRVGAPVILDPWRPNFVAQVQETTQRFFQGGDYPRTDTERFLLALATWAPTLVRPDAFQHYLVLADEYDRTRVSDTPRHLLRLAQASRERIQISLARTDPAAFLVEDEPILSAVRLTHGRKVPLQTNVVIDELIRVITEDVAAVRDSQGSITRLRLSTPLAEVFQIQVNGAEVPISGARLEDDGPTLVLPLSLSRSAVAGRMQFEIRGLTRHGQATLQMLRDRETRRETDPLEELFR